MPPAALAFLSYAHNDDWDGQVTRFVERLRPEISSQLGRDFPVFRDRDNLEWGENWRRRINESLDSVTFLIAVLSPSFFQSEECQRELERFREREAQLGRDDLILPVVWIEPDEFSDEKHQLGAFLRQRQYVTWEDYRLYDPYPVEALRKIAQLAKQVKTAVRRQSSPGVPIVEAPNRSAAPRKRPIAPTPEEPQAAPGFRERQQEITSKAAEPSAERIRPGTVRTNPDDGQAYVWIPPGEFQMGCSPGDSECYDDEKPAHTVRITRGFWLGRTPVTQAAYQKVLGKNPSQFKGDDHPVESVSWEDARRYCEAVGGRLPTEAEWEYAARAGSTGARYGDLDEIAWYGSNSGKETHPVGQKKANGWGLYDMLGNVLEWVADWHDEGYYRKLSTPATDPKGPESREDRVLRGGSWGDFPWALRVSYRGMGRPVVRDYGVGVRCAREVLP